MPTKPKRQKKETKKRNYEDLADVTELKKEEEAKVEGGLSAAEFGRDVVDGVEVVATIASWM